MALDNIVFDDWDWQNIVFSNINRGNTWAVQRIVTEESTWTWPIMLNIPLIIAWWGWVGEISYPFW